MEQGGNKIAAPKKRSDTYEPKVKSDLSFDELIAISVGKKAKKKEDKSGKEIK